MTSQQVEKQLFWGLLLLLIALRFWNLFHLPFSYDELSTLYRVDGTSWAEISEKIKADNHPPGHHLIVWGLESALGTVAWIIKLPFLLAGVFSLVLVYKIGKQWFHAQTGIWAMGIWGVSQLHLIQSQTARPYALAQFFILLFVFILGKKIVEKHSLKLGHYVLLLLSIVACAYLHYIALLVVASLYVCSIILFPEVRKDQKYWSLPILSILACLPMYSFFLAQWQHKSLSTIMTAPDLSTVFDHFYRLVNFFFPLALIVLFVVALRFSLKKTEPPGKRLFFFLIFFLPALVLWIYSVTRGPLFSDRSLFFGVPFMFLFLFSFLKIKTHSLWLVAAMILGCFSLIFEREHYTVFYHQGFEDVASELEFDTNNENSIIKGNADIVLNYNPETYQFPATQRKHPNFNLPLHLNPDSTMIFQDFVEFVESSKYDFFIYANTAEYYSAPLEIIPLIESKFPKRIKSKNYFLSHYYLFQKEGKTQKNYSQSIDFKSLPENRQLVDSIGTLRFYYNERDTWGLELRGRLNEMTKNYSDYVFFRVLYEPFQSLHPRINLEINKGGDRALWRSNLMGEYRRKIDENLYEAYVALNLSDLKINPKNLYVKAYVWNVELEYFNIIDAELWTEDGNPYQYALTQPF